MTNDQNYRSFEESKYQTCDDRLRVRSFSGIWNTIWIWRGEVTVKWLVSKLWWTSSMILAVNTHKQSPRGYGVMMGHRWNREVIIKWYARLALFTFFLCRRLFPVPKSKIVWVAQVLQDALVVLEAVLSGVQRCIPETSRGPAEWLWKLWHLRYMGCLRVQGQVGPTCVENTKSNVYTTSFSNGTWVVEFMPWKELEVVDKPNEEAMRLAQGCWLGDALRQSNIAMENDQFKNVELITKASLLAGVGFPLGMYWGQSWGSITSKVFGWSEPFTWRAPPSAGSNPPWSMCFEGVAEGHFFGEKTEWWISQECKHPIWYCHIALMHLLPGFA